jgi:microcystin-dependent protein
MSYTLNQTDGTPLLVLVDGKVDIDSTSISLIGKNVSNFGDAQNENFLHMLENFSNVSQPKGTLLKGQVWYNKSDRVLRPAFYDGTAWRPIAVLLYSNTSTDTLINGSGKDYAANRQGDLWFDSVNRQLHIVTDTTNGTVTTLIGPESVDGFGISRLQSVKMTDVAGASYPVIHMALNGEVIGMISPSTFTPGTTSTVAGFARVYRGITLKNYNSSTLYTTTTTDVQLHGLHEQLDPTFVRRNVDENIQSNWSINNTYSLNFGTTAQSSITWSTATTSLTLQSNTGVRLQSSNKSITFNSGVLIPSDATINLGGAGNEFNSLYVNSISSGNITPKVTNTHSLGTIGNKWSEVFAVSVQGDRIIANTATVTTVIATNLQSTNHVSNKAVVTELTATTLSFGNLKDSITTATISKIDIDGTLSSNSDANLATQKAIKTYIDFITSNLQTAIAGLSTVPTGSVFYIVQPAAPAGYLVCDGSLHSITSFPSLFAAIGYSYGGSGSTFRLPDLRGEFIRGHDGGRGVDLGRALGSSQEDLTESHIHSTTLSGSTDLGGAHVHSASSSVNDSGHQHLMPGDDQLSFANGAAGWPARSAGGFGYDARSSPGGGGQVWLTSDSATGITVATSLATSPTHTHGVSVSGSTSATGGAETRPRNVALTPIIKT